MQLITIILLTGVVGSLTGCYSFKGARENVGVTGPMVEGTWAPCCDRCCYRQFNKNRKGGKNEEHNDCGDNKRNCGSTLGMLHR